MIATPTGLARLTARQSAILQFMRRQLVERHRLPTLREIAAEFGMRSPNGVNGHIRALARHGVVQRLGKQQAVNYRLMGVRLRLEEVSAPPPDEDPRLAEKLSCRSAATAGQDS